jgi:hypothetical protein
MNWPERNRLFFLDDRVEADNFLGIGEGNFPATIENFDQGRVFPLKNGLRQ